MNADGTLKVEKVHSVDELTDEDFTRPVRNVELPELPENKESKAQKTANMGLARFLLAHLGTFDQMLRMFGKKNVRCRKRSYKNRAVIPKFTICGFYVA